MYRYIKTNEEVSDSYIQPYTAEELIRLIDKAIKYAEVTSSHKSSVSVSISSKPIYSFFVTTDFEKGVKALKKSHKAKELKRLREVILLLSENGTVNGRFEDHRVGNKYRELKLGDRNILLVWRIVPGSSIITVSIELTDITDHDSLNKSINKDHQVVKEYINDENFSPDDILDL